MYFQGWGRYTCPSNRASYCNHHSCHTYCIHCPSSSCSLHTSSWKPQSRRRIFHSHSCLCCTHCCLSTRRTPEGDIWIETVDFHRCIFRPHTDLEHTHRHPRNEHTLACLREYRTLWLTLLIHRNTSPPYRNHFRIARL